MEEVPTNVHPGSVVLDVLMRQHEHMSGLIWSGDHETCITDLQCRCFVAICFKLTVRFPTWAWSRIPVLRPQLDRHVELDPLAPLGDHTQLSQNFGDHTKRDFESMDNDDEMCYLWTIRPNISKEGIHVLVEFELTQSQTFSEVQHTNVSTEEVHPHIPQHVMAITLMRKMMTIDDDDEDYVVSSESDHDNDDNDKEDDISTPINPLSSIIMNQWQSNQWFSNASYNYTQSGAFLGMGSGEQIDDLIETDTIRLLD
ncbi:hypothetical protein M9H77_05022 [Catharanthus roseus]|uniref:Uncharacterized protein n=1 Tax=Catharanthus roseus TaxID=4058 RepID=A0ACC0CFQ2_CATRO|nr:hypothetical protein M9H77_05022 [Catharanthus roseus]